MDIVLRLEKESDYRIVENLTREAFWNVHQPGSDEHLLVHTLRKDKGFIKDLDFVAIVDDEIVGNIIYVERELKADNGMTYPILVFGPIGVLPKYQGKGIGSRLIEHTIKLAKEMKYKAILIYGYPDYYQRFGFRVSKDYCITNGEGKYPAALLVLELYQNSLDGISGVYDEGDSYRVDEDMLKAFDADFPVKEKSVTKTQEMFNEFSTKYL